MFAVPKKCYLSNTTKFILFDFYSRPSSVEHQHSAMKHFFSYVDDIETKVRLTESITRTEFETIVRKIIGNDVDPKEIDLFFKVK